MEWSSDVSVIWLPICFFCFFLKTAHFSAHMPMFHIFSFLDVIFSQRHDLNPKKVWKKYCYKF